MARTSHANDKTKRVILFDKSREDEFGNTCLKPFGFHLEYYYGDNDGDFKEGPYIVPTSPYLLQDDGQFPGQDFNVEPPIDIIDIRFDTDLPSGWPEEGCFWKSAYI